MNFVSGCFSVMSSGMLIVWCPRPRLEGGRLPVNDFSGLLDHVKKREVGGDTCSRLCWKEELSTSWFDCEPSQSRKLYHYTFPV